MLSLLGSGLLRGSTSWVVDEVGVPWAELEGDCEGPGDGDAVPEPATPVSFFLDEDDLAESLALES